MKIHNIIGINNRLKTTEEKFKGKYKKENSEDNNQIVIKPSFSTFLAKGSLIISMNKLLTPIGSNKLFSPVLDFLFMGAWTSVFLRETVIDLKNKKDKDKEIKKSIFLRSLAPIITPLVCLGVFLDDNKKNLDKQGKIGAALGFGSVCLANIIDSVLQYKKAKKQLDKFDKNC